MARSRRYSYRKPAAELIRGREMADGHLEKRHLSSGLSRGLFPRGGENYKCISIARRAALLYRKSRPYGGLLNRGGFIKERMESCRAVEGSRRSWGSFVCLSRAQSSRNARNGLHVEKKKKKKRKRCSENTCEAKSAPAGASDIKIKRTALTKRKKKNERADNTSLRTFERFACSI